MTPDSPSYSNHKNPQSWNLYAYALNNPVTFRDADGHKIDCANNTAQCQADAAAATGNAEAAARVTTETTKHGWWIFSWTETSIKISGDINTFRALSPNASKLADLVTSKDTITVSYDQYAKPSVWQGSFTRSSGLCFTPSFLHSLWPHWWSGCSRHTNSSTGSSPDLRGGLVVAGGDVAVLPPVVPSWVAGAKALAAMVQASSEWRFESCSVIVIRPSDNVVLDDGRWVHAERGSDA